MNKKIVHIYNWWKANNLTTDRMIRAKRTWQEFYNNDKYGFLIAEFSLENGQRNSLSLGEKKTMPFLKDVVDYGLSAYPDCDLFLYTNSDISFVTNASNFIRDSLKKWECGYSHRVDFSKKDLPKNTITRDQLRDKLPLGRWSAGSDVFFFTRRWWNNHKGNLPDALIGFEAWDACVMAAMLKSGLPEPIKWLSYHQIHESYWKKNRLTSKGQLYNRKICTKWAIKNNLGHLINYGSFLFKLPTPYNVII
ncbi:MAG: hypothetical protein ACD_52C00327G0006 [uncultured bacterium]|uniref:Uncharacterized protein n=1 Tax=Candidatus Woesebacteria bacterium RIFCSPHIGHO2_12_FULL_41_24 TaxID=1802510 RepID=A0A1F8ARU1_9BACT|nr:MAG: hypothetical protein ACD_52C00327G0006 [uncultured bacterium]OGM14086.1 MAG: hypothetical protein A2W15_03385 [Candidatus Woesebacteria bacterium RBG_16_41_13]OGM29398.1 MAG: hypothetical protein A2873_04640 [Candidatus Woesebacteria bacterium RIFCSPHIGHO2_01_FULL_42_80]OGM34847.1 MAG: hypothetical protein A3D84_03195 [Candidatus Woesebacteria bacterium RIFCSPHIGHO2_02_FULL_42_20]OGM54476.1 MAG: hypothetical protein A3E44_00230 [Candidatus Woesebacteria bacterium RIFCSPHIGHO2_12_FULL_41